MLTLTIRIPEARKEELSAAALRAGLTRIEKGEITGNVSGFIGMIARALADKSPDELRSILGIDKP